MSAAHSLICFGQPDRRIAVEKVPSIPGRQWEGVLGALEKLGIDYSEIRAFVHGTTIATNALLERKGAKWSYHHGRLSRYARNCRTRRLIGGLFDINSSGRSHWCRVISEWKSTNVSGGRYPKTAAEVDFSPIMEKFRESGVESIAIAFMNACNDANEAAALAKLQALAGDIPVCASLAWCRKKRI